MRSGIEARGGKDHHRARSNDVDGLLADNHGSGNLTVDPLLAEPIREND